MKRMAKVTWAVALVVVAACGYGKDTGPKHPRPRAKFEKLVGRFVARVGQCLPELVQAGLNRPMTEAEKADANLRKTTLSNYRTELMQCLTGEGYGNEIQVEPASVEKWLQAPDCAAFAKAVSNAPECSALQLVLEDSGFKAGP